MYFKLLIIYLISQNVLSCHIIEKPDFSTLEIGFVDNVLQAPELLSHKSVYPRLAIVAPITLNMSCSFEDQHLLRMRIFEGVTNEMTNADTPPPSAEDILLSESEICIVHIMKPYSAPVALKLMFTLLMNFDCTLAVVTKFTNLQCESLDPSVVAFPKCILKVVGRGIISFNIDAKVLKPPLTKLVINIGLYKKANGYKPFLYNTTIDYCNFANRSERNIIFMIAMNFAKNFSNLNHSCPINHDIQIKNMLLSEDKFRLLPLPTGEYMMHALCSTADKWQASVKAYITRTE